MGVFASTVRRPVTVLMICLIVVVLGGVALTQLPLDLLPDINLPMITVLTGYPGAGPAEVERNVTRPIEKVLGTVNHVRNVTSVSSEGISAVMVELDWGTDMDFAALELRERLDQVKDQLPKEADSPRLFKLNPNLLPIAAIGVTGPNADLRDVVDKKVVPRLQRIEGVASVTVSGGAEKVIKITMDPEALKKKGLAVSQVVQMLQAQNMNFPVGKINTGQREFTVRVTGDIKSLEEIKNLVVGRELREVKMSLPQIPSVPNVPAMPSVPQQQPGQQLPSGQVPAAPSSQQLPSGQQLSAGQQLPPGQQPSAGQQPLPVPNPGAPLPSGQPGSGQQLSPGQQPAPGGQPAPGQQLPSNLQLPQLSQQLPKTGTSGSKSISLGMKTPTGPVIRLKDIATVTEVNDYSGGVSRLNGDDALQLEIQKRPAANTVNVVRAVKAEIEALTSKGELPSNVNMVISYDQGKYIEKTIGSLARDAIIGGLFAILVVLLFLRNLPSTLTIAVSIPMSVITALVLMYLGKINLNMISLGGLALVMGRLIDDAIVVFENIFRHMQEGQPPAEAAVIGVREVAMPVTASTLTTMAVFVPIYFASGLVGVLFDQMALTVIFALTASLLVALLVVPTIAARFRRVPPAQRDAQGELVPGALARWYGVAMRWVLGHKALSAAVVVGLFILSAAQIPRIGMDFMPHMDQGSFMINVEMPAGTPLDQTNQVVSEYEKALLAIPEVQSVSASIGGGGGTLSSVGGLLGGSQSSSNTGTIMVELKDKSLRGRSTDEIIAQVRGSVIPPKAAKVTMGDFTSAFLGGSPVQVNIFGPDLKTLKELGDKVAASIQTVPGVSNVQTDYQETRPEIQITVDKYQAAKEGLTPAQIAGTLRQALAGDAATKLWEAGGGTETDIIVQYQPEKINSVAKLKDTYLISPQGNSIRLGDIATIQETTGPVAINRDQNDRVVHVTASLSGRALDQAMADVQKKLDTLKLPDGYYITTGGEFQQMTEATRALGYAMVLGIVLVYMIIASQFESLLHPFTIMFALPLALIGVVAALLVSHRTIDIMVLVGAVLLVGIVVSNSIILVDFINVLKRRGLPRTEAIVRAGMIRLRPILMTALTTLLALVPLAFAHGEGSEFQQPLAITVIGGLTTSTLLTLFIVPLIYYGFDVLGERIRGKGRLQATQANETH